MGKGRAGSSQDGVADVQTVGLNGMAYPVSREHLCFPPVRGDQGHGDPARGDPALHQGGDQRAGGFKSDTWPKCGRKSDIKLQASLHGECSPSPLNGGRRGRAMEGNGMTRALMVPGAEWGRGNSTGLRGRKPGLSNQPCH